MPLRTDLRLTAVVLGAALLLTGCAAGVGSAAPSETPRPKPTQAEPVKEQAKKPAPAPLPTHLHLDNWDPETSGNGLVLLDGPTARASMLVAMRQASPVTMKGTFTGPDERVLTFDVSGSRRETVAEFTTGDAVTVAVISGGQAYVGPSTTALTCVAEDDPEFARWSALLHPIQSIADFSADASALGAPEEGIVDLLLGAEGTSGTLGVRAEGPALPVTLTRADAAGTLQLTLSGWGESLEVPDLATATGC